MAQVDASAYAFAGVEAGKRHFEDEGRWYASGDRLPDPGDLIFFDWNANGEPDHVGLVAELDGEKVKTIEGNSGDACKEKSYPVGYYEILGYGVPAY